jgi:hypothetical protein
MKLAVSVRTLVTYLMTINNQVTMVWKQKVSIKHSMEFKEGILFYQTK